MKTMRFGVLKLLLFVLAPMSAFSQVEAGRKTSLLTVLVFVLVSPMMAQTDYAIVYKVCLADGTPRYYQIMVPARHQLGELNSRARTTPSTATTKISELEATRVALGWAGGFYKASDLRIDSVEFRIRPVPHYLIRMTGQIGPTRQILYAAVLEDGQLIRPSGQ
jgi:hypothetical protein